MKHFFLILLLLHGIIASVFAQDWTLQKESDGIQIYTRFRSDSVINEFKGVMRLRGDIDSAFSVLSDMSQVTKTDPTNRESRVLATINPQEYYFYQLMELPFFLGERDLVSHVTIAKTESGYFLYGVSEPDYIPHLAGITRIENSNLVISVRKISRNTFELTLKGSAELPIGNSISKAVMNRAVVGAMHHRMQRMQELLGVPVLSGN